MRNRQVRTEEGLPSCLDAVTVFLFIDQTELSILQNMDVVGSIEHEIHAFRAGRQ
jgi:hypothetical protein